MPYSSNIDFLSNLDNLVYTILGISTMPLAPAPIPAKPAKITLAASKLAKKEGLQCFKRTAGGDAGRYTTDSSFIANKDDNNAYNRAYIPPTDIEEEEGSSSNNNSVNSGTSDSTDKGEGGGAYKYGEGASRCKDTLLRKRQYIASYPYSPPSIPYADIYVYYV
ncbi:hypothetical protein P8C59_007089 [Phyllachora maydis]|uniref:Uncharacterized protein n=1 Tax=Phyllachora maydis TaxID=1825666 RepID=A0AAD9I7M1_9PEZI|nr:hypothetical protein P8C59_007089 [Phyllachora maydis]